MLLLPRLVFGFLFLGLVAQENDPPVGSELKLVLRDRSVIRGKLTGIDGPLLKLLTPLGTRVRVDRSDVDRFVVSEPPAPLEPPNGEETAPDRRTFRRTVAPPTAPREQVVRRYELSKQGDLVSEYEVHAHHRHGDEPLEHYRFLVPGKVLEVTDGQADPLRFNEDTIGSISRCRVDLPQPLEPGDQTKLHVRVLERKRLEWRQDSPMLRIHHRFDRPIDLEIELALPACVQLIESSVPPDETTETRVTFRSRLEAGDTLQLELRFAR